MELALSALASFGTAAPAALANASAFGAAELIGGGTAAGFNAASAGGGLLSFLGTSPVLGILSGASSAVSILQTLRAGGQKSELADLQAMEAQTEGIGEQAAGAQRSARLKKELLRTLGENDVAFAASGVDLGYGAAADSRARSRDDAYGEIAIDRATTNARVAGFEARRISYERMSRRARSTSLLTAFGQGLEGVAKLARRG